MAKPIADQIYTYDLEVALNKRVSLNKTAQQGDSSTSSPTIKSPTKDIPRWKRPGAKALCLDPIQLLKVCEYDYDLSNTKFQAYLRMRGKLHLAGTPLSERWAFFQNFNKSKAEFLASSLKFAELQNNERYAFSPDEMETHWKIILIGRGALQDCWELFQTTEET